VVEGRYCSDNVYDASRSYAPSTNGATGPTSPLTPLFAAIALSFHRGGFARPAHHRREHLRPFGVLVGRIGGEVVLGGHVLGHADDQKLKRLRARHKAPALA
jgi:hypothetical protein